ncbi:MAG: CbtA family protein, partial [Geminicoccaceae bacterium]
AGLLLTVVQRISTVPLIKRAEVYEAAEPVVPIVAGHDHGAHDQAAWAPQDGLERTLFTVLANVLTGIGFALLLVAAFALRGREIGWRDGLLWGIAGFAVFTLAPSLGLPPELPGMPAAELGPRQAWWLLTAAATAGGLALLAFRRAPVWALAAVCLIAAPHLVGAPQPRITETMVPESLAHQFVVAVTVTSFLFWATLGVLSAVIFQRIGRERELAPSH